jgi:hypothetical protein
MSSLLAFGDFQLKTIPLALFYFLFAIQTECQQLEIIPGDSEQVVQAGSHLTLTCTYQYVNEYDKRENNISWILPSYLTRNPVNKKQTTKIDFFQFRCASVNSSRFSF